MCSNCIIPNYFTYYIKTFYLLFLNFLLLLVSEIFFTTKLSKFLFLVMRLCLIFSLIYFSIKLIYFCLAFPYIYIFHFLFLLSRLFLNFMTAYRCIFTYSSYFFQKYFLPLNSVYIFLFILLSF